jgi:hypothetical protein
MSNENIDIKDINTTSELSQEEMDAVKGGATTTGSSSTGTPTTTKTGTPTATTGTGGTTTPKGTGITQPS